MYVDGSDKVICNAGKVGKTGKVNNFVCINLDKKCHKIVTSRYLQLLNLILITYSKVA